MKFPKKKCIYDPRIYLTKFLGRKCLKWMLDFDEKEFHRGIVITGDSAFRKIIDDSLTVLKENDKFRYELVARYIKGIYGFRKFQEFQFVSGLAVLGEDWVKVNQPKRVAAYLVRIASLTQLFSRFHLYRIREKGRAENVLSYKQELITAHRLGSTMSHIMHLEKFIEKSDQLFRKTEPVAGGDRPRWRS